jgi:hypothetical protein
MISTIMRLWVSAATGALCAALSVVALTPRTALAVPKNKPHSAAPRRPTPKNQKKAAAATAAPDTGAKADDAASADKTGADQSDKSDASSVKAAGTSATKAAGPGAAQATVQEDKAGVKTYKFGTVEVEGRMKSPQIIYFLRRVRAEFDAGTLGHRSFMRELSDTRNDTALR